MSKYCFVAPKSVLKGVHAPSPSQHAIAKTLEELDQVPE